MTQIEAMKQALFVIHNQGDVGVDEWIAVEKALHQAIAEAEKQEQQLKIRTGDCLLVGVCASEGHKIAPQRQPLTDEQWQVMANTLDCFITRGQKDIIEAALGIKGEA